MNEELKVFFAAMTPFVELKFAIPLGFKLGLSKISIITFASLGAMFPVIIGLAVATPFSNWLMKHFKFMNKFLTTLFHETRRDHSKRFDRYGAIIVFALVALPFLPGSGAAAGALIGFIFGVHYWKNIGLCTIGTITAAILLTTGVNNITKLFHFFFS